MRICIIDDSYLNSESPLKGVDLPADPLPYLAGHECERFFIHKATAVKQVIELSRRGYDLFLNLCDGAWDEDRPGIEVVQTLERLGVPFTGATSAFFEPSREKMKLVCHYWGIATPASVQATTVADIERAAQELRFPLIVKHPSSYGSIGMSRHSRVEDGSALRVQANLMMDEFGAALIEEFIEGREFTVLVAENPDDGANPLVYQPVEFHFPAGESFKHFDMKWVDYQEMGCTPCTDPELANRLRDISARFFVGMQGTGYGRCDMRMGQDGELYMLEINPNCGIFYPSTDPGSADYILQLDPAGHAGFVDALLRAALKRAAKQAKPWVLRRNRDGLGYGMIATRPIQSGEIVEPFEEQPHVLVSQQHVLANWNAQQQGWFHQYAYPVSDNLFVMWHADPEAWKPINHSCDPSCWLSGLNLTARRPIAPGEAITVDYATFCADSMESFVCTCGAAGCRGVIRGSDHLQNFVAGYGDHISDYVRAKRAQCQSIFSQELVLGFSQGDMKLDRAIQAYV